MSKTLDLPPCTANAPKRARRPSPTSALPFGTILPRAAHATWSGGDLATVTQNRCIIRGFDSRHEHITGCRRLCEDGLSDTDTHLVPNVAEVAAKVMDGEAILINLANGMYYSMDGAGGFLWT